MPVQIPIRTDIHDDFKTKVGILKRAAHFLPTRRPFPQIPLEDFSPAGFRQSLRASHCIIPTAVCLLKQNSRENFRLRLLVILNEPDLRVRIALDWNLAKELTYGGVP